VWPPPVRRFYLVTAVMLLLALIPMALLAVHGHSQFRDAIAGYKDLLYILVGLTIALELSERLWWPLVNGALVLSVIVSILSLLAAASGSVASLLARVDGNAVTAVSSALGATSRIRLPGLFLVYAMTIPTLVLVLLVKDRWRSLRIVALALMVGAIAVSLNRNMYFGGVAGLLVTLLVGGGRLRYRFLISAVTIAAIVAVVVQSTVAPAVTTEIGTRAQSALSSQVLSTASARTRNDEFSSALTSIARHPWTGVGWFQNYGSYELGVPRLGVEDWYLHLATDLGIPVALAFLLIPAVLLSYGLGRARRAAAPLDRALVAAGMGALVALLLSCLVGSYLQDPNSMTAFGFACGFLLAAVLRATPKGETSPSSDPDDQAQGRGATPCA
jgi:O-antigen ligase